MQERSWFENKICSSLFISDNEALFLKSISNIFNYVKIINKQNISIKKRGKNDL